MLEEWFRRGYWTVGTVRGLRFRVHWSFWLGLLLFGGLNFVPGFWLGFTLLLVGHELGHAALVKLYGYEVLDIDLTGLGGVCRWSGWPTPAQRAAIAWGGVLAQALIFIPSVIVVWFLPRSWFLQDLFSALTWTNLWLIALNLIPVPMLDGGEAWRLFRIPGGLRSVMPWRARRGTGRASRSSSGSSSGWFPRGVGWKNESSSKGSKKRKASHLRDVSLDADRSSEEIAADLLRIAEEAKRARNRPN